MRKIKNPWRTEEDYFCFGCCPHNEHGLHMEFYEDGDEIVSILTPDEHYQSWSNTLHGGIQAVMLDEICGWTVARKLQTTGVTSKLELRYVKPVHIKNQRLTLRAHLTATRHQVAIIEAELWNCEQELCTKAKAIYFTTPQEKARENGFRGCFTEDEVAQE